MHVRFFGGVYFSDGLSFILYFNQNNLQVLFVY
jgi:hypothetical protein